MLPAMGALPHWTLVCPPPWAEGLPAFRVPLAGGLLMWANRPLLKVLGGTSPKPPGRGLRPLHPRFPTPLGFGFASVLGPTRGRVANVGKSPPHFILGAHPPDPLPGGFAPWTPVCSPSLAEGLPAFWVPLVAGSLMWATRPFFFILGAHPPSPLRGGCAPSTPVGLGFASVLGPTRGGVAGDGCSPPTAPRHGGFAPLAPRFPTPVG